MKLLIATAGYESAAEALWAANHSAAYAYDGLTDALRGFDALGGDDASSEDFVREYDGAAQAAVDALRALVQRLGHLGDLTRASGDNHRRAEERSVIGRSHAVYTGGIPGRGAVSVPAVDLPTSLGGDDPDLPSWWNHVVDHLQGWGWPSASVSQLRSADSAWRSAAVSLDALVDQIDTALAELEAQRSPEIPVAALVFRSTQGDVRDLATAIRGLGEACDDYATQVEETRDTIRDLLKDLAIECGVTAGVSGALSLVTFGGAAAAGAGLIAVRAARYARRIIEALKALKAARAVLKLSTNAVELTRLRAALERLSTARALVSMERVSAPELRASARQLQKKFAKHAKAFGVDGHYNPRQGERFARALDDFVRSPDTQWRSGFYRGKEVMIGFDKGTGQCAILQRDGTFVSGWKLSFDQLTHVIKTGKLGGS